MSRASAALVEGLRVRTRQLEQRFLRLIRHPQRGIRLRQLHRRFAAATGRFPQQDRFAEHYAQAVACTDLAAQLCDLPGPGLPTAARAATAPTWFDTVLQDCQCGVENQRTPCDSQHRPSLTHFYEDFLESYNAQQKSLHGVYYTPQPVAAFIVRSVHATLRLELGLEGGLADTTTWRQLARRFPHCIPPAGIQLDEPFVRILDPAVGTGAFLVEVIDVVHHTMLTRWQAEGRSAVEIAQLWQRYVPQHLLTRLFGLELLLAPLVIAHMQVLAKLAATGYRCPSAGIQLYLADTLQDPLPREQLESDDARWANQLAAAERVRCELPFTVVLGNPPFSGISDHHGEWIRRMLRGRVEGVRAAANYYEVDGRGLGERKLWLQDDYVKFLRYAQWCIERSGVGVIGFVTNHGYLDNATFRGMRQQLIKTFPRISVLDLHGNRKKKESPPGPGRDENVFGIEQGVAVGLFRRWPAAGPPQLSYGELWGEQRAKLAALAQPSALPEFLQPPPSPCAAADAPPRNSDRSQYPDTAIQPCANDASLAWQPIQPRSPYYFFTPQDDTLLEEYERGLPLNRIMPVHSTAAVTARDSFVVALDKSELLQRMRIFRDLSIPDDEIRRRFFTNSRSKKYPAGDTRGWKLAEARRRMAQDRGWQRHIRTCLYRPFDRRAVYWSDWMIDWPRAPVMRHMIAGPNLALIARRQMLPTQTCNYFWVSDDITIDGVIRSDNRGSESLFPLYLYSDGGSSGGARANLDAGFVAEASRRMSLEWTGDGKGDLEGCFGPEDLLDFLYAQFHSPTYRLRYAAGLRIEFPRVFLPSDRELFRELCQLGRELVTRHRVAHLDHSGMPEISVAAGFPKYESGRVFVNADDSLGPVAPQVWRFQAGAHQVCRKWLSDRRRGGLSAVLWNEYRRIVAEIGRTLHLMQAVDRAIDARGGWPRAFLNP